MYAVYKKVIGGQERVIVAFMAPNITPGLVIKILVPAGNPFWVFNTVPVETPDDVDFTEFATAPLASTSTNQSVAVAENAASIAAIMEMVDPEPPAEPTLTADDVFVYNP